MNSYNEDHGGINSHEWVTSYATPLGLFLCIEQSARSLKKKSFTSNFLTCKKKEASSGGSVECCRTKNREILSDPIKGKN